MTLLGGGDRKDPGVCFCALELALGFEPSTQAGEGGYQACDGHTGATINSELFSSLSGGTFGSQFIFLERHLSSWKMGLDAS